MYRPNDDASASTTAARLITKEDIAARLVCELSCIEGITPGAARRAVQGNSGFAAYYISSHLQHYPGGFPADCTVFDLNTKFTAVHQAFAADGITMPDVLDIFYACKNLTRRDPGHFIRNMEAHIDLLVTGKLVPCMATAQAKGVTRSSAIKTLAGYGQKMKTGDGLSLLIRYAELYTGASLNVASI